MTDTIVLIAVALVIMGSAWTLVLCFREQLVWLKHRGCRDELDMLAVVKRFMKMYTTPETAAGVGWRRGPDGRLCIAAYLRSANAVAGVPDTFEAVPVLKTVCRG